MNRFLTLITAGTFLCTGAFAADDPFSTATKSLFDMIKGNLVKAAEKMPEANYSFKPTPEVRSFGQIVGHVADAQFTFCSSAKGEQKQSNIEKTKTSKADLVAALKDSVAYCEAVYTGMNDPTGMQTIKFFGNDTNRLGLLEYNVAHDNEHYGNIVTYMRMKGLVPPSSERSSR